jgi:hypothetical protein
VKLKNKSPQEVCFLGIKEEKRCTFSIHKNTDQCHHIVAHYMYNEDMSSFVMKICMMLHKIVTKTLYDSNDKEEEFSRTDINML